MLCIRDCGQCLPVSREGRLPLGPFAGPLTADRIPPPLGSHPTALVGDLVNCQAANELEP